MSRNVYQELWDLDLRGAGCSVTSRDLHGEWSNPNADIKLDEQAELSAGGGDAADRPLIADINEAKIEEPTYQRLKSLLDNYVFNARLTEDHLGDNAVEDAERESFLDAVLGSEVMRAAHDYVASDLQFGFDDQAFRNEVRRLWFEVYTNFYQNNAVSFCTGFEHTIVGESKGNPSSGGIGGYHSWTKYWFDQSSGRVDFKGFNYDNKFNRLAPQGATVPQVATISFSYAPLDMDGQPMGLKRKNLGGFFVGPSPELQIAYPVVAYFQSLKGEFFVGSGQTDREKTEKEVEIHDAIYRLVLYMETRQDQSRGDRLRSFFPKFVRLKSGTVNPGGQQRVDGEVSIVALLANAVNPEAGREWVEIENRTDRIIDLTDWSLRDHRDRPEHLLGTIEPGERRRVAVTRQSPAMMQLANGGGAVRLLNNNGHLVSSVDYPRTAEGEVVSYTV